MKNEELFKEENLIFVSKNGCRIGSLYFRAVEGGKVFRGRIRLVHENGPKRSSSGKPEDKWLLVNEAGFSAYKEARKEGKERDEARKRISSTSIYGNLIEENYSDTLCKAKDKKIYEVYTSSHPSRGNLVLKGNSCITPNLTQDQINLIIKKIEESEVNTPQKMNQDVIELVNTSKFPKWIEQKDGEYGC